MKKVYIVSFHTGAYESMFDFDIKAFLNEDKANEFQKKIEDKLKEFRCHTDDLDTSYDQAEMWQDKDKNHEFYKYDVDPNTGACVTVSELPLEE